MTKLPLGACDSHVHVFQPDRFPYVEGRNYTPGPAGCAALRAHLAALGLSRCVVVQPSVHGADNRCLLEALRMLGSDTARGVAVVDPQIAVAVAGDVPLILDHHAGFRAGVPMAGDGFRAILRALEGGNVWVKLSAPYRSGCATADYAELRPAAQAMIAAAPERMVWASDWPHTGGGADRARRDLHEIEPFRPIDSAADLQRLAEWVGDDARLDAILSANPARLFDFPHAS